MGWSAADTAFELDGIELAALAGIAAPEVEMMQLACKGCVRRRVLPRHATPSLARHFLAVGCFDEGDSCGSAGCPACDDLVRPRRFLCVSRVAVVAGWFGRVALHTWPYCESPGMPSLLNI